MRLPLGMGLGGVFGMLGGMEMVAMREMCVVNALLVVLLFMMLCRLLVVLGGLLVMLGQFG